MLIILVSISCKNQQDQESSDIWKNEIRSAEASFAKMATEIGVDTAFITFAAPDAILMRNNTIISGKDEIRSYFSKQKSDGNATLTWSPDFVDVAGSGDLGYTYGKYRYTGIDTAGQIFESKGVFHTVWKRQADGSWRFVWD